MRSLPIVLVLTYLSLLSGCGSSGDGGSGAPPDPDTRMGGITGTLLVPGVNTTSKAPLATLSLSGEDEPSQPDFVPGEMLLRFKPETNEATVLSHLLAKYESFGLTNAGQLYPDGPYRLRTRVFGDTTLAHEDAKSQTESVLRTLETEPSVAHVELNYMAHSQQTTIPNVRPNDTAYVKSLLWGQRLIDLPNAWGVSTGRSDVVVAVLDTGIRPNHPELSPLLVPGADFVSKLDGAGFENSGDGDGYDSDPTDPGPFPATGFHGTHVAATIAAVSNNGKGVSGVAWGIRIMPVRVLGLFGGNNADIISGMRWAAGLPVNGQGIPPLPTTAANVINMSLGGPGRCSSEFQAAVDAIVARGISVVVASGNSGSDVVQSPASCRGVIAVTAVDVNGNRSPYSSFQNYVFIAAPGGDTAEGPFGGIVSAINVSASQPTYGFSQGTSMAAPHVSGVIALMHSAARDAGITRSDANIKSILQSTAVDRGPPGRDREYGFGILQAGAAVRLAKFGSLSGLPAPYAVPYPRPNVLVSYVVPPFQPFNFSVVNIADVLGRNFCFHVFPPNEPWLSVEQLVPYDIFATFNGTALPNGLHETEITVQAGDCSVGSELETFRIPVVLVVGFPEIKQRQDAVVVRAFGIDPVTQRMAEMGRTTTSAADGYRFTLLSLRPGLYYVEAGVDVNGSGQFGDGGEEIYGIFRRPGEQIPIPVKAGILRSGVDFRIVNGQFVTPLN
jgi:serine protease